MRPDPMQSDPMQPDRADPRALAAPRTSPIAIAVALAAFGLLAAIVLPLLIGIARPLLAADAAVPEGWTSASALATVTLGALALVLLAGSLYRRLRTRMDEQGLLVPGWRGSRRVPWSDIVRVSGRGLQIRLHTAGGSAVAINPLCYARPRQAMTYMLSRLPRPVVPAGRSQ